MNVSSSVLKAMKSASSTPQLAAAGAAKNAVEPAPVPEPTPGLAPICGPCGMG